MTEETPARGISIPPESDRFLNPETLVGTGLSIQRLIGFVYAGVAFFLFLPAKEVISMTAVILKENRANDTVRLKILRK